MFLGYGGNKTVAVLRSVWKRDLGVLFDEHLRGEAYSVLNFTSLLLHPK